MLPLLLLYRSFLGVFGLLCGRGRLPSQLLLLRPLHCLIVVFLVLYRRGRRLLGVQALLLVTLLLPLHLLPVVLLLLVLLAVLRLCVAIFQMVLLGWHFHRGLVSLLAVAVAVAMARVVQKMMLLQVLAAFVADTLAHHVVESILYVGVLRRA